MKKTVIATCALMIAFAATQAHSQMKGTWTCVEPETESSFELEVDDTMVPRKATVTIGLVTLHVDWDIKGSKQTWLWSNGHNTDFIEIYENLDGNFGQTDNGVPAMDAIPLKCKKLET